jgi:mRNA interferase RelE/StbE
LSRATQIYYASFDVSFFKLPPTLRARIEGRIDEVGAQLRRFPHHRLKGSNRFRLRIGDYRVIYAFDIRENKLHLLALGHRREIYRER